jgi:hypothetical protein
VCVGDEDLVTRRSTSHVRQSILDGHTTISDAWTKGDREIVLVDIWSRFFFRGKRGEGKWVVLRLISNKGDDLREDLNGLWY